jgi:hypothetical protein
MLRGPGPKVKTEYFEVGIGFEVNEYLVTGSEQAG